MDESMNELIESQEKSFDLLNTADEKMTRSIVEAGDDPSSCPTVQDDNSIASTSSFCLNISTDGGELEETVTHEEEKDTCADEMAAFGERSITFMYHDPDENRKNVVTLHDHKDEVKSRESNFIKLEDSHTSYRRGLEIEITDLKLLLADAQTRADTLSNELSIRNATLASTTTKLNDITEECEDLKKRNQEITEVMNHLQSNAKDSALGRASLLVKVEEAMSERDRFGARYRQFRNENRTLKKERERLKDELESSKAENKRLKKEIDKLRREGDESGYSTANTHKPLSHYLNGLQSDDSKTKAQTSRTVRRKKRNSKLNSKEFFRAPWASSHSRNIVQSNLIEDDQMGETSSCDEVGIRKTLQKSSSAIEIGTTSDYESFPQPSLQKLKTNFLSDIDNDMSDTQFIRKTRRKSFLQNILSATSLNGTNKDYEETHQNQSNNSSATDMTNSSDAKVSAGEVSSNNNSSNTIKWNWLGNVNIRQLSETDHGNETFKKIDNNDSQHIEDNGVSEIESIGKPKHQNSDDPLASQPVWLEGMSKMLLPKRMASAGM